MTQIIFWILIFLIIYSYSIYPLLLRILSLGYSKNINLNYFEPEVSIIIPVYNEEHLIEEKISSIFRSNYPIEKIEVIVYSDGSTDKSVDIINHLRGLYPCLRLIKSEVRKGKSFGVNKLVAESSFPLIMLTDANIIFKEDTIRENLKHYQIPEIGLVGSTIINQSSKYSDITLQEKQYISWENILKYEEGLIWGATIAPFGACLSFRKSLFEEIPRNFLVDDFFIGTTVLQSKYKCVVSKESICFEELNGLLGMEFKRRVRISTGNFQNLAYFFPLFFNLFSVKSFCFWSHKGLRWMTPFFLILIFFLNTLLLKGSNFYQISLCLQLFFYCIPLTDYATSRLKSVNKLVKFVNYFLIMNVALFVGFFNYLRGVNVGYWKTTLRDKSYVEHDRRSN
jgi:cellulose synthase/poly-beta-1,6-N-acetylglucosamine synthase-like glycosyltransferase